MFYATFKGGVSESLLYFGDWMRRVLIYAVETKNGDTLFLIKPKHKFKHNESYVWVNSNLFL
jgi:predicted TPR repeat methyltransferase